MKPHRWIVPPARPRERALLRLVCFHHAGSSAACFAAWHAGLPDWIDVYAAQLPRAYRFDEAAGHAAHDTTPRALLDTWIDALLEALVSNVAGSAPFAFYGHSLGALVAYELVCALRRAGEPLPVALAVSGRRAPHCELAGAPLALLDDTSLVAVLERMGGVAHGLLHNDNWRTTFLPTLRDDLRVSDLYAPRDERPLDVPLLGFRGQDDPILTRDEFDAWRAATIGVVRMRELSGAHFFDAAGTAALQRHIAVDLESLLTGTKERP
ncbi:hypothetical protein WI73_21140 [Burkholderia ubonensis]|uniref:thioesterase II family protein n=1 Tax=Burkholderia ubonensis TaxID=101571 RepID=UPI00075D7659|nr:thioesterase domain-containing protein [Burkholderia ubonensis]AYZ64666.1 thioesterase [Burkholderia multivorans]AOI68043.1 hypothetical protein WI31_00075 [Burkholderia ubonensis]KUZ22998.1 hypothetical protein WI29_12375 [Burkholderia ubonensis]KUZ24746.1 hypothetical protein WI32_33545 [Burkholderia ubonensis]KUZ36678.1 hypothetical protein WI30_08125 [Burkholderia ubonensis]